MPVTPNNDVLLEIFELFVSMDDDGPFKIFFLSKTWRATVLSHPSLWSWITVDATREDWQERIHTSIALSQNCSLHLTIKCEDSIPPDLFQLNKEGFARVRTITLHVLDDEHLKQNVLDLHSNRIIANIDKVEQLFSKDSNAGTTVIISNIGIVKWVKNQDWLKAGDPEPPIDATHPFVRDGVLPADAESVFEAFLDRHLQHAYCCMWAADGTWCRRVSSPRPRAVNHVYLHLDYRPFRCHGECENLQCNIAFTTSIALSAHVQGAKRVICQDCGHVILRKNLARHIVHCVALLNS